MTKHVYRQPKKPFFFQKNITLNFAKNKASTNVTNTL